jgi:hypothetical protein
MSETLRVHALLVTGPIESTARFACTVLLARVGRRGDTVFYTCLDDGVEHALEAAVRADLTLQEIAFDDLRAKDYTLLHLGSHGMKWI